MTELFATLAMAQRVVILLAASDVTVLHISIPPLSAAKLKAALPNLVEDQLLGNPADCVVVAGNVSDGLRTVAVVQRVWLELVTKTFMTFGARHISVLPAQLCLPCQTDRVVAAVNQQDNSIDLTLRLSAQGGMGLAIAIEQPELAAHEVVQTLCAVVPEAPITLYVPLSSMPAYHEALNNIVGLKERISITADNWPMWIKGAHGAPLNLMTGLSTESGVKVDWHPWRWALILAASILIVNICALNIDWWQMKNEAATLRATMTQIYQARYPKEFVIIDPIAQMRQKIAFAKRDAGLASADDFTTLAAAFGEAWNSSTSTEKPAIAKLDYREHSLLVTFKSSPNGVSVALLQQIKPALASRNLSLTVAPSESGSINWQIRSAK